MKSLISNLKSHKLKDAPYESSSQPTNILKKHDLKSKNKILSAFQKPGNCLIEHKITNLFSKVTNQNKKFSQTNSFKRRSSPSTARDLSNKKTVKSNTQSNERNLLEKKSAPERKKFVSQCKQTIQVFGVFFHFKSINLKYASDFNKNTKEEQVFEKKIDLITIEEITEKPSTIGATLHNHYEFISNVNLKRNCNSLDFIELNNPSENQQKESKFSLRKSQPIMSGKDSLVTNPAKLSLTIFNKIKN